MATADVARLRFILSADAGGLKAGTKEAAGSLKDFNDAAASRGGKGGEAFGEKWFHGMSHKLRGLRHVAGDFGIGGPLGQAMGVSMPERRLARLALAWPASVSATK